MKRLINYSWNERNNITQLIRLQNKLLHELVNINSRIEYLSDKRFFGKVK